MPLYDSETFDKSLIPNHFKTEVREVMEVAVLLGWKLHVTGNQSVTIISPQEEKKYHFSSRRNSGPLTRIRKDVVKFADPDKLVAAEILKRSGPDSAIAQSAADILGNMEDGKSVIDARPTKAEVPTPRRSESEQPKEATVVSEKPMLAKSSHGKGYESKTTFERKWSDGSVDYRCMFRGCEQTSHERRSISRHYANVHSKGVAPRPADFKTDVPGATPYAPRKARIEALAAVIEGMLAEDGDLTPEDLARASLMWVHEQSKRGTEHAEEREPMSAEDTLTRIRSLLDDGSRLAERQKMEALEQRLHDAEVLAAEQAEQAAASLAAAEQRAVVAEQRAEATRASLKALGDLLSEVTQEQAG